jgi:hypothetical protein
MSCGIQRGVGEHGDADKFDLIQDSACNISPTSTSAGQPTSIDMVSKFVSFIASVGQNTIVGADKAAHTTSHTGISRVHSLLDTVIHLRLTGRSLTQPDRRFNQTLTVNT